VEVELTLLVSLGVGWALVLLGFGGREDLVKIFFLGFGKSKYMKILMKFFDFFL
jgi:hypothetical protein